MYQQQQVHPRFFEENMAERDVHEDFNEESSKSDEDFNEESGKSDEDLESSSDGSVLAALNIALIISSLSSPDPDEQPLDLEVIEERRSGKWNRRGKNCGSRSEIPMRKQQVSGFSRALERQQTKIRDCRHSRRL